MNYQECLGYQITAGANPLQAQAACAQYRGVQAGTTSGIDQNTMLMIGAAAIGLMLIMRKGR